VFRLRKKELIPAVLAIAFIFGLASFIPVIRNPLLSTLKYPLYLVNFIGRELKGIIFYHRNFTQNERLKIETDFLKYKLNSLSETYAENRRLKGLLALKEKTPYKVIAARVIARSPDNWSSLVVIDKGANQGIRRDMAVMSFLGLAGRVVEVAGSTSKVMLVNDSDFAVSALVQRSRKEGLIAGTLGASLAMRYLDTDTDIRPGDAIITSGLNGRFPKGLLIGRVVEVNLEFSGLSKYALVRPAVNLSGLEEVLVIIQ
jgi:rod shape-determining protein MreC